MNVKPKPLSERFVPACIDLKCPEQEGFDTSVARTQTQKKIFKPKYHA